MYLIVSLSFLGYHRQPVAPLTLAPTGSSQLSTSSVALAGLYNNQEKAAISTRMSPTRH